VRAAAVLGVGLAAAAPMATAGCGDNFTAVLDSFPIALTRAPVGGGMPGDGALVAMAADPSAPAQPPYRMLVGTGTPLTLLAGPPVTGTPATQSANFDLLDAPGAMTDPTKPVVRGRFRGVSVLRLPLQPVDDAGTTLGGVLGGDILRRFSVEMRFGATPTAGETCLGSTGLCSSMTFFSHQGADLGFLEDAGYAVLRFGLAGGGETTAKGDPDFLGQRGPLVLAPSRIVLRTCAAPNDFAPDLTEISPTACCKELAAEAMKTGVDLALVLDTGVGPMVLSASAWTRLKAALLAEQKPLPAETGGQLLIPTWPNPIPATWSTIPRFAVVDLETGSATDPGPCLELNRARRLEQVSFQVHHFESMQMPVPASVCTQQCDSDPREPDKSQNSAAYLELSGAIPVAVIADDEGYLQGLRFDIRPEGPEVDGVIGAGALGRSRVEIDYLSGPQRAVFSCESDVMRPECFAAARCPRLPDASYTHLCFGLSRHGFAPVCQGC
jgi:hypothetical protein